MTIISQEKHLKRACVHKKGNKYYVPKTLPKERASRTISFLVILILIIAVHFVLTDGRQHLPILYTTCILCLFAVCISYRCLLFVLELEHSCSRYEDDKPKILKAAFHFELKGIIVLVVCLFYFVYHLTRYKTLYLDTKDWYFVIPFLFVLHKLLDLDNCPINDSLNIAKDDGLDYGSGMAYSFFYGYINYMLMKKGNPDKDLKEMMEDYESSNNIKFEVYKIFILIPKSLNCFESIQDGSEIMEMRSTLPEKKITVAGVRERVYKHSVYSIKHPKAKKHVYVCAEFATPLKTFKEVFTNATAHTEFYNRHRNDILLQFYLTLRQILQHNKMDRMCELVFYEDLDKDGNYHDVGRILLTKIEEVKKRTEPKDESSSAGAKKIKKED